MKKNGILTLIVMYGLVIIFVFFIPIGFTTASEDIKEIDIMTTPEKVLFEIHNMQPGDWATRELEISNSGKQDFGYIFSAKKSSGSEKLYNELHLTIEDESGKSIYDGSLGNFEKLEARNLKVNTKEKLTFTVEFPYELGNEYQGLVTEVEFKVYAEGTLGGLIPVDNGLKLPKTATGYINVISIGAALLLLGMIVILFIKIRNKKVVID